MEVLCRIDRIIWSSKECVCSLVISIFLYACETWTLTADFKHRIKTMEMRCYPRLLNISYTEHVTKEKICPYGDLLTYNCQNKEA